MAKAKAAMVVRNENNDMAGGVNKVVTGGFANGGFGRPDLSGRSV